MQLKNILVPTYLQLLSTMKNWFDKAAQQLSAEEAEALLAKRLAPDMFPLSTQVSFSCRQALEGMYRLRGEAFPDSIDALLNEGRNAGEKPGTLAETKARIDETLAMIETLASDMDDLDSDSAIAHDLPIGLIFDFTATEYVRDWALGQFYFHVIMAYAILRNQGIELGKADYVGHLMKNIRPGSMPG